MGVFKVSKGLIGLEKKGIHYQLSIPNSSVSVPGKYILIHHVLHNSHMREALLFPFLKRKLRFNYVK